MIDAQTFAEWQKAAKAENYAYLIHPTGNDPAAYEKSGKDYADLIMSRVKSKGIIMDYGCGNGRILRHIREPKVGIDIVPEAAAMVGGFTPDAYKGKVDVIYSVNVLIHNSYASGKAIIRWMHGRLKKGGMLLLQMPIYDKAKEPANWLDVGVWTKDMLIEATEGFRLEECKTNPGSFTFETIGPHHFEFHTLTKL